MRSFSKKILVSLTVGILAGCVTAPVNYTAADAPYAALVLYQMGDVDSARQGLLGLLKARHSEMIRPLFWHFLPYDETRLFILEQDAKMGSKTVNFDTVQMLNQLEFSKQLNEALRGDASLRCLEELYSFESIRTTYYRH